MNILLKLGPLTHGLERITSTSSVNVSVITMAALFNSGSMHCKQSC